MEKLISWGAGIVGGLCWGKDSSSVPKLCKKKKKSQMRNKANERQHICDYH